MKALIISNDDYVVSQASSALKEVGSDLIVYKWLLKALDNIEEIKPDLILISANEYPRHWKTLVQFIKSGIGGDKIAVYLYEGIPLSEDDLDKAKALGITGYIKSFSTNQMDEFTDSIREFFGIEEKPKDISIPSDAKFVEDFSEEKEEATEIITVEDIINTPTDEEVSEQVNEDEISEEEIIEENIPEEEIIEDSIEEDITEEPAEEVKTGYILFNNPKTQIINTGKVSSFINNKLECKFDYDFTELENNDYIQYASFFDGEECISFSAEINIINNEEKTAVLTIQEKYEEI